MRLDTSSSVEVGMMKRSELSAKVLRLTMAGLAFSIQRSSSPSMQAAKSHITTSACPSRACTPPAGKRGLVSLGELVLTLLQLCQHAGRKAAHHCASCTSRACTPPAGEGKLDVGRAELMLAPIQLPQHVGCQVAHHCHCVPLQGPYATCRKEALPMLEELS